MTLPLAQSGPNVRNVARSVGAIAAGFIAVFVLSLGTDQVLHVLNVYPPWGQPMWEPGLNLLALGYRILYTILGGYITARLAPHSPVRHAMILGVIGLVLSTAGAVYTITKFDFGPDWYPILLAVTALPCSWLGGELRQRQATGQGRPR